MNIPGVLNVSKVIDIARLYVRHLDNGGDVAHVNCKFAMPSASRKSVTLQLELIDKDGKLANKTLRCERMSVSLGHGKYVNLHGYYRKMDDNSFYVCVDSMDDDRDLVHVERYLWDRLQDKRTNTFHDSLKVMMNSILKMYFAEGTRLDNVINCYSDNHDWCINIAFTAYRPGNKSTSFISEEKTVDTTLKTEGSFCQIHIVDLAKTGDGPECFKMRLGVRCEGDDNEWSYKFSLVKKMVEEALSTRP